MNKRPLSITIIGCVFILVGVVGITYHAREFNLHHPFESDVILACVVRLFAIVCGVFMLRGRNWARWGVVVWLGYHVMLSIWHSPVELLMHCLLLAVIVCFLFRRRASMYFRNTAEVEERS